jgi:hypothetical protein
MDAHLAQELLNELGSSLETLETQQAALLQFLKDKGIVTEEQLAPYLNEAGNASSVRWRAAHVRLEHLFSAAEQRAQQAAGPGEHETAETKVPRDEQRSVEAGKAEKSDVTPVASEKARKKEEEAESADRKPEAHDVEQEPSPERREKDAA